MKKGVALLLATVLSSLQTVGQQPPTITDPCSREDGCSNASCAIRFAARTLSPALPAGTASRDVHVPRESVSRRSVLCDRSPGFLYA